MWQFLYQFASPKYFYQMSGRALPWLGGLSLAMLLLGMVWGLGFAPSDYQQGDAYRIIFVHVPAAFLSMMLYALMSFCAVLLLVWRIKLAGLLLTKIAEIGATMAFLALVTGSIWGKPMWGTWWVWDARLTSELILLLIYASILVTHRMFSNQERADRMIAILALIGSVDLPIIHYSVNWWNTLHQGSTLSVFAKPKIDSSMLYPLLLTLFGFLFYSVVLVFAKSRDELLYRERKQAWVKEYWRGIQ